MWASWQGPHQMLLCLEVCTLSLRGTRKRACDGLHVQHTHLRAVLLCTLERSMLLCPQDVGEGVTMLHAVSSCCTQVCNAMIDLQLLALCWGMLQAQRRIVMDACLVRASVLTPVFSLPC